jgi:hypothetical protein
MWADTMRKKEQDVVQAFVAHLGRGVAERLQVDRWPDLEDRTGKAIDAVAGRYAIEHTSIDALDGKRASDPQFMAAVGDLEHELQDQGPFHLRIDVPYRAIAKGQDWSAMRAALSAWITGPAHDLPFGRHSIELDLAGVPMQITVHKSDKLAPGLYFVRSISDGDVALKSNITRLVNEKARKLLPYATEHKVRVLLLEGDDIAMLNHVTVAEAIEEAFPEGLPEGVDQIWYADTALGLEHVHFYDLNILLTNPD